MTRCHMVTCRKHSKTMAPLCSRRMELRCLGKKKVTKYQHRKMLFAWERTGSSLFGLEPIWTNDMWLSKIMYVYYYYLWKFCRTQIRNALSGSVPNSKLPQNWNAGFWSCILAFGPTPVRHGQRPSKYSLFAWWDHSLHGASWRFQKFDCLSTKLYTLHSTLNNPHSRLYAPTLQHHNAPTRQDSTSTLYISHSTLNTLHTLHSTLNILASP